MKRLLNVEINPNRIYGLDILRAFAILFVVVEHGTYLFPMELGSFIKYKFVLDGVSMFFVLSGFLIGGILIKLLQNNAPTKGLLIEFWIRRWFRTLPNYFLVLLIIIVVQLIFVKGFTIGSIKQYFFFIQNIYYPHPQFFNEAWSLSIEEWFYIITPLCMFVILSLPKTTPKQSVLITSLAILTFTILFRHFRFSQMGEITEPIWDAMFRKQVVTRLDGLMLGVVGAYVQFYYQDLWQKYKFDLFMTGLFIFAANKFLYASGIMSMGSYYNCVLSFLITSIATLCLLPFLSTLKTGKGLLFKWITLISLISYSMYLLHFSVIQGFVINRIPWYKVFSNEVLVIFVKNILYWTLTILCSIIIYKYYEIPMMKLRDSDLVKKIISK